MTPGQGTYLGCGFDLRSGHMWDATDKSMSLSDMDLSLSLPLFLLVKSINNNNNIFSGEDFKKSVKKSLFLHFKKGYSFLWLSSIPQYGCATVSLLIHLLKGTWVVSSLGLL